MLGSHRKLANIQGDEEDSKPSLDPIVQDVEEEINPRKVHRVWNIMNYFSIINLISCSSSFIIVALTDLFNTGTSSIVYWSCDFSIGSRNCRMYIFSISI